MKIKILSRWSSEVKFECELGAEFKNQRSSIRLGAAIKLAIKSNADLCGANLCGADLCGADLCGANLCDADLSRANLRGANLSRANLCGADLCGADLCGANLCDADLSRANLCGANLCDANLTQIRDDIWAVFCSSPAEVATLRQALIEGKVDGSTYSGECACLVGTLAHAKNTDEHGILGLMPNSDRPAERFFMGIKKGDTPETSQFSKIALAWTDEWLANMRAAFGERVK